MTNTDTPGNADAPASDPADYGGGDTPGTALILGITGGIGDAIAAALAERGWHIAALTRRAPSDRPDQGFPVDWRAGDALDAASVAVAAEGVALIVHAVNPPGYRRWREDGLPMLANTIAAARRAGATIVFPANVYVYSPAAAQVVDEATPRQPETEKGRIRLEMEGILERAARDDGVPVIAVRAGDFFGPGVVSSWFSQAVAKGGMKAKAVQLLTPPGIGHAWAYTPDLAEAFARLVDRRATLDRFTLVHFAGHYDRTGMEMSDAVRRATGRPDLPVKRFPWFALWLAAPFVPFFREALKLRWLWQTPLALDNSKLEGLIGPEPHTPVSEAVMGAIQTVPKNVEK